MKTIKITPVGYFNILLIPVIMLFLLFPAASSRAQNSSSDIDIVRLTKNLMGTTEMLRGLEFIDVLPVDLVTAEEMAEIIDRLLDEEITSEDDHQYSSLYIMLGLMPRGSSLRSDYQVMTEEQVAGLYDAEAKRFYVVDIDFGSMLGDMLGEDSGALGDFLGGLLEGMGGGLSDTITNTIIVHELTHALDDQYYDLEGSMEALQDANSDDASLAYQSLVEGNATRIMNDYTIMEMGIDSGVLSDLNSMNMSMAEGLMDYNPFLERLMLIPYMQGEVFVRHIYEIDGQEGIENAFRNPPVSMEQILHPERYTTRPDVPSYAPDPDLSDVLNNWELETTDTLGELMISLVFEFLTGDKAQAGRIGLGWDYDVVTTWRSESNDLAMAWVTVWDSEDDAQEFYDAYMDLLELKYTAGKWEHRGSSSATYTMMGYGAGLDISGKVVTLVEGVPENLVQDCLDAAHPSNVVYN